MGKKIEKIDEEIICGVGISAIRTAYFKGKLPKLLLDIQATGEYEKEEYEKLKMFLATLKKKDEFLNKDFAQFLPAIEVDGPDTVLDELNRESLSEAELAELSKEQTNREHAVRFAGAMLKALFNKFYDKNKTAPNDEDLMTMGFELLALEYYLIRDCIYKERLFRKKIVEYERLGKQRKLAEEYSKTTVEYRDFKLSENLIDMCKEFINMAKKRYKNI